MRVVMDSGAAFPIESLCERRGMTQVSCMSRLVIWFCDQDDKIQNAILVPQTAASLAAVNKLLLKKLAHGE